MTEKNYPFVIVLYKPDKKEKLKIHFLKGIISAISYDEAIRKVKWIGDKAKEQENYTSFQEIIIHSCFPVMDKENYWELAKNSLKDFDK